MLKLVKRIILHLIYFLQSKSIYQKIGRKWVSQITYIQANETQLEKYAEWIFPKQEMRFEPAEEKRKYIIALNKKNKYVGSVMIQKYFNEPNVEYCILYSLKIQLKYRRLGIGNKLTLEAMQLAKKLGYSELFLSTSEQNIKAQKLYESIGFKQISYNSLIPFYKAVIDSYPNKTMLAFLYNLSKLKA
ncbi:GNAT family N-acetyltransferase [Bacteroidota bacterium]